MTLVSLVLTLAIAGFVCWLILQIPMIEPFRKIIIALVIFFLVLWVLQGFGLISGISGLRLK